MNDFSDLELAAARSKSAQARFIYFLGFAALLSLPLISIVLTDADVIVTQDSSEVAGSRVESPVKSAFEPSTTANDKSTAPERYPVTPHQIHAAKFLLGNSIWSERAEAYLQATTEGLQTATQNEMANEFVSQQSIFERQLDEKLSENFSKVSSELVSKLLKSLPAKSQCDECMNKWRNLAQRLPEFLQAASDYQRAIASMDIRLETKALVALDDLTPGTNFFDSRIVANEEKIRAAEKEQILGSLSEAMNQIDVFDFSVLSDEQIKFINADPDLARLKQQLDLSNEAKLRSSFERKLQGLAGSDNWLEIIKVSKSISANLVTEQSETLISTAGSIAELQAKTRSLINNPSRLSDYRVQKYATTLSEQNQGFNELSAELSSQDAKLNALLIESQRPLQVTLISDGKTEILIPRVGRVAPTQRKQIELRPGAYRLIGRCKGALDNEFSLIVDRANLPLEVEVNCGPSLN